MVLEVLWVLEGQRLEILFHPFLQVDLVLLAAHSGHSGQGSQVFLAVPVLPVCLETQVCQSLQEGQVQCVQTQVDWERGSGWSCSEPCDLRERIQ